MLTSVWTLWFAQLQMNLVHGLKTLSLDQQYIPLQTLKKLEEICLCLSPNFWQKTSALFFVSLSVLFLGSLSVLSFVSICPQTQNPDPDFWTCSWIGPWLIHPSGISSALFFLQHLHLYHASAFSPLLHSLVDLSHPLLDSPFLDLSWIYLFSHLQFQAARKKTIAAQ